MSFRDICVELMLCGERCRLPNDNAWKSELELPTTLGVALARMLGCSGGDAACARLQRAEYLKAVDTSLVRISAVWDLVLTYLMDIPGSSRRTKESPSRFIPCVLLACRRGGLWPHSDDDIVFFQNQTLRPSVVASQNQAICTHVLGPTSGMKSPLVDLLSLVLQREQFRRLRALRRRKHTWGPFLGKLVSTCVDV